MTRWRLTLAESLALVATVITITLWVMTTFQSKTEANEWKSSIESRMGKLEVEMATLRTSMEGIRSDVSYIRGRLEPKNER